MPGEPAGSDNTALARKVLALAESRAPTLGSGRLICIDGLAGSGKTTFADELGHVARCRVIHLDDIYPGWRGLEEVAQEVLPLLAALREDRPGRYRRWDWTQMSYVAEVTVDPTDLLVIEGVGSGQRAWADLITVLVWIDASQDVRLARGLARDGVAVRDQWVQWQDDELALLAREQTDVRADLRWRT